MLNFRCKTTLLSLLMILSICCSGYADEPWGNCDSHGYYPLFCVGPDKNLSDYLYWPDYLLDREGGLRYWLDPELPDQIQSDIQSKLVVIQNANSRFSFTQTLNYKFADLEFWVNESTYQRSRPHFHSSGRYIIRGDYDFEKDEYDFNQSWNLIYYMLGMWTTNIGGNSFDSITLAPVTSGSHGAALCRRSDYPYLSGLHHVYPERSSGCEKRICFTIRNNCYQGQILTSTLDGSIPQVGINESDLNVYNPSQGRSNYAHGVDAISFGKDWTDFNDIRLYFSYRQPMSTEQAPHLTLSTGDQYLRAASVFRVIDDQTGKIEIDEGRVYQQNEYCAPYGDPPMNHKSIIPDMDQLRILDKLGRAWKCYHGNPGVHHMIFNYDLDGLCMNSGTNPYFSVCAVAGSSLFPATIYYQTTDTVFLNYSQLSKLGTSGNFVPLTATDDIDALLVQDLNLNGVFNQGDRVVYSLNMNNSGQLDRLYMYDGTSTQTVQQTGNLSQEDFYFTDSEFIDAPFDIDALDSAPGSKLTLSFNNQSTSGLNGHFAMEAQGQTFPNSQAIQLDNTCPVEDQSFWVGPDALRYNTYNLFSLEEGTIVLSFKNLWAGNDNQEHVFVTVPLGSDDEPYRCLYLGKYSDNNFYFQIYDGQSGPPYGSVVCDVSSWAANPANDHVILANWVYNGSTNMIDLSLNIDGQDIGNASIPYFEPVREFLVMGYDYYKNYYESGSPMSGACAIINEFRLYDRCIE